MEIQRTLNLKQLTFHFPLLAVSVVWDEHVHRKHFPNHPEHVAAAETV